MVLSEKLVPTPTVLPFNYSLIPRPPRPAFVGKARGGGRDHSEDSEAVFYLAKFSLLACSMKNDKLGMDPWN